MNKKGHFERMNRKDKYNKLCLKKHRNNRKKAARKVIPYNCVFADVSTHRVYSILAIVYVDGEGYGYPRTMRIECSDSVEGEDAAVEWAKMHYPDAVIYSDNLNVVRDRDDPLVKWAPRETNLADRYTRFQTSRVHNPYEEKLYPTFFLED